MLGQAIKIGKQYRLNIRPNPEFRCPNCDIDIGAMILEDDPKLQGMLALVTRTSTSTIGCPRCKSLHPAPSGIFHARLLDGTGDSVTLPYTWLEPLEEADA